MSRISHLPGARGPFLSLHWKGFLLLSILLLALSSGFGAFNYLNLRQQFHVQRTTELKALRLEIKGLLDRSTDRLQRLGIVLASLGDLERALSSRDEHRLSLMLGARYASVRYELDVESIELFTPDGERVWRWTPTAFATLPEQRSREVIARIHEREQPLTLL